MSPKYKLTYFKTKGRAEPIRVLLAYGKQEFEDNFIERDKWPEIKPTTPFGKVPLLEIDGKVYHQSLSICRYLAKKFGVAGSSDEEALQIDAIIDTCEDFTMAIRKNIFTQDEAAKEAGKKISLNETVPFYASKLDNVVKANGGYFVNGKLSWADIYFATTCGGIGTMLDVHGGLLDPYPNLKALQKKVFEEPNIKTWLSKRTPI